jgi:hypothetical protein
MSEHPAYQEIINMGTKIVLLLLSELKKNPLYWLSALSAITGENPIQLEQRGRIKQMASAWIEWGRNQGYAILPQNGSIDLQSRGINQEQAANLRARLQSFAEDWNCPEMDVYDAL